MKEYKFKINGHDYEVTIGGIEGNIADVKVNGTSYSVELGEEFAAAPAPAAPKAEAPKAQNEVKAAPAPASAGAKVVKSPLPGVIISVDCKEGQAVKRGQKLAVIEAMKMENEILAPQDGTISGIHVSKGDSVLEGADIVTIA